MVAHSISNGETFDGFPGDSPGFPPRESTHVAALLPVLVQPAVVVAREHGLPLAERGPRDVARADLEGASGQALYQGKAEGRLGHEQPLGERSMWHRSGGLVLLGQGVLLAKAGKLILFARHERSSVSRFFCYLGRPKYVEYEGVGHLFSSTSLRCPQPTLDSPRRQTTLSDDLTNSLRARQPYFTVGDARYHTSCIDFQSPIPPRRTG